MLGHEYFYNGTIKNMVAAFGQMFNDIQVAQLDAGKLVGSRRVPLAYAPKEKYLARIEAQADRDIALRLPRMSFEMTGLSFDQSTKLNRLNRNVQTDSEGSLVKVNQCVPYTLDFSLNIMSRGQDEALQIVEQILPHFNPNYTLSAKGLEGPESITDIPITLSGVSAEDAYEGDFESSRRLIVYTLTFTVKTKFTSNPQSTGLIKSVDTFFNDFDTSGRYTDAGVRVRTGSQSDTEDSHTVVIEIGGPPDPNVIWDDSP